VGAEAGGEVATVGLPARGKVGNGSGIGDLELSNR
jgi:hypothetical protein